MRIYLTLLFCWIVVYPLTAQKEIHLLRSLDNNRAQKTDSTDFEIIRSLKTIPIGRGQAQLSMGGEIREQYRLYQNPVWGAVPEVNQDRNGFVLHRLMWHTDFSLSSRLRVFGQLTSNHVSGKSIPLTPQIEKNELDVYQLFLDVKIWRFQQQALWLRLGRQEYFYGRERMLSMREGPNVKQAFDGATILYSRERFKAEVFVARPVITQSYVFDDAADPDHLTWGIYGHYWMGSHRGDLLEPYYLAENKPGLYAELAGSDETRHSIGLRWEHKRNTHKVESEATFQWGKHASMQIRAYQIALDGGVPIPGLQGRLWLHMSGMAFSGDNKPGDQVLGTFCPIAAKPPLREGVSMGPANLIIYRPYLLYVPANRWKLKFTYYHIQRFTKQEGVYNSSVNRLAYPLTLLNGNERIVGNQADFEIQHRFDKHFDVYFQYCYFPAGDYLKADHMNEAVNFYNLRLTYKF